MPTHPKMSDPEREDFFKDITANVWKCTADEVRLLRQAHQKFVALLPLMDHYEDLDAFAKKVNYFTAPVESSAYTDYLFFL